MRATSKSTARLGRSENETKPQRGNTNETTSIHMCQDLYTLPLYAWNRRIFPAEVTSFPGDHATPGTTIFSPVGGVKATRREDMKSGMTKRLVVVLTVGWLTKWITTTITTTMMMIRTVRAKC
jgi:hypothetical protein